MLLTFAIVLLLVSVNALYVAAEFAAVSVRRSRIQQAAEDGDRLARQLLPVLEDPHRLDRYIACCQIGITLSSLILGAYGQVALQPVLAPLFERFGGMAEVGAASAAATTVLLVLTAFQVVLGELFPKSLALQFPTAVARYTVIPMRWSLRLLTWFIAVLNGSGNAILRSFGVRPSGHRHIHQPDEIDYLISESRKGGILDADEHLRLRRALQLGVRRVEEIMIPRVHIQAVAARTSFAELARIAAASHHTRLPVFDGSLDRITGLLHLRDLAARALEGRTDLEDLVRPIAVIPASASVDQALARLREAKRYMAVVVDEHGGTAGLLTMSDVLDEIFGGLASEFDDDEPVPERLADGRVRLPGSMRLEEAESWVGAVWEGDAYTVGGLVLEKLGHLPEPGETVIIEGIPVQVERVERAVESVLAGPLLPGGDAHG
jgi:CBS domain containing-hemolysin-like protein